MGYTQFGSKAIATLLTLLILTSVVAAAGTVIDDFEGGTIGAWDSGTNVDTRAAEGNNSVIATQGVDYTGYSSDPNEFGHYVQIDSLSTSSGATAQTTAQDSSDNDLFGVQYTENGNNIETIGANNDVVVSGISADTWYRIDYDVDYANNQFTVTVRDIDGNELGSVTDGFFNNANSFDEYNYRDGTETFGDFYFDYHTQDGAIIYTYTVSGTVTDGEGAPLNQANINITNQTTGDPVENTTTNNDGNYSVGLPEGNYTIGASKAGYETKSENITVTQAGATQDFTLESTQGLTIKSKQYIKHGEYITYKIVYENATGRFDVTDTSTVTSNDTSLVTVNTATQTFNATEDTSRNNQTFVTAEYTNKNGQTFTVDRNITVANQTVDNIGILPTAPRVSASFQDQTIQLILIATMIGAAAAIVGRVFAGLGAMSLLFVMGWVGGFMGNGMVIVSFMMALFIGLNIAANIDYTVRR